MPNDRRGKPDRRPGWSKRVAFDPGPDGYAYVPGELVTPDLSAVVDASRRLFPDASPEADKLGRAPFARLRGVPDVPRLVAELRRTGVPAQPNHVLFGHGCGCSCGPHPSQVWGGVAGSPVYASPVYASPVYASPVYASPVYASPVYASPVYASPVYASPVYASDLQATGRRPSSARPAVEPALSVAKACVGAKALAEDAVQVVVLDTGLATSAFHSQAVADLLALWSAGASDGDQPDDDGDQGLDPAAGHGTFIAGLVQQGAPGSQVTLRRVLHAEGDGDEVAIAAAIDALPEAPPPGALLNLSFGGYALDEPALLASAVAAAQDRGWVVVASAGNDATCRPTYPAALPGVVSVGAVGPNGPAPFTNHGPWVRACAPGVDLVSTFFAGWDGDEPAVDGDDPDAFSGWARWSGTSFAAPVVTAALAREMATRRITATEAVARVVDSPALLRIPGLGTVVNVA